MMRPALLLSCLLLLITAVFAKDKKEKDTVAPGMVMLWPNPTNPTLKLTFDRFVQLAAYNGQISLESHVLIENLSGKLIPQASFTVYLLDKDKVRIGNGNLSINDLDAGQQARLSFQVFSIGLPTSLSLVGRNDAQGIPTSLKTVSITVISVPAGASLKVDGRDEGTTPKMISVGVGNHILEFNKEGYAAGSTPLEIKSDELSGGSITLELGGLSGDTVELRDGSVLQGDAISMSLTSVVFRVNGKDQTYDRNQIKKIILVQRQTVQQPPVVQPVPQSNNK